MRLTSKSAPVFMLLLITPWYDIFLGYTYCIQPFHRNDTTLKKNQINIIAPTILFLGSTIPCPYRIKKNLITIAQGIAGMELRT